MSDSTPRSGASTSRTPTTPGIPSGLLDWFRPGAWSSAANGDPIEAAVEAATGKCRLEAAAAAFDTAKVRERERVWLAFDELAECLSRYGDENGPPTDDAGQVARVLCAAGGTLVEFDRVVRPLNPFANVPAGPSVVDVLGRLTSAGDLPASATLLAGLLQLACNRPGELLSRLTPLLNGHAGLVAQAGKWVRLFAACLVPPDSPTGDARRPDGGAWNVTGELERTDREGGLLGRHAVLEAFASAYGVKSAPADPVHRLVILAERIRATTRTSFTVPERRVDYDVRQGTDIVHKLWTAARELGAALGATVPDEQNVPTLADFRNQLARLERWVAEAADGEHSPPPQCVKLDQVAAFLNVNKQVLTRKINAAGSSAPAPMTEGGGGKATVYDWRVLRPWLVAEYARPLPARFPNLSG